MADRNLALSLLITAKDAASAVLGRVRAAVTGVTGQNQQYAAGADSSAAANNRFAGSLGGVISRLGALAAAYLSINGLKSAFESVINVGAKFETLSIQVNNLMGSIEAGEQATAWIKDFAKNTPLELDGVTKAFVKLKAFGLDPMDGTLQSLTDLTSKLGGGQAELEGIVLAVGQAWSKQKLQTEEINQLVERGVPVWDLLAKVTGRTTAELQKLAEQGALGRDVIKALITEIGQSSAGSSAAMMATWTGLISNLQDSWTNFLGDLAKSGVLDAFKEQVASIQVLLASISSSDELKRSFTALGTFIVGAAKAIEIGVVTAGFAVDQLGRGIGALAAKLAALATLDFSGIEAIDKAFNADSQNAIKKWSELIGEIQSPPPIEIKTTVDTTATKDGLAQVEIGANAAIEKFKEWDKQSTTTVDNIASELRKLSDVELANLKASLQKSFDAGTQSSEDLQKALAAIKTEDLSRAWKTLGQESSASLKKAADSAKAAYVTIRDSGTASAADLDKAWASVTKQILAAKDATNAADAAEKQRRANIAELDQIGATPEEKLNAKRKLLTDQTIAYDKSQREGDYAEAARIAQEKEQLAFQNARAEIEAAQSGEIASYRAYDAKQAYLRAIEDTKKALSGLSQQEKTALDNAGVETQQQSLEKLQATLSKFNQPIEIKLTDNFDQILARADQVAARIAELNAGANNVGAGNDGAGDTTEQALSREVLKRGRRTQ